MATTRVLPLVLAGALLWLAGCNPARERDREAAESTGGGATGGVEQIQTSPAVTPVPPATESGQPAGVGVPTPGTVTDAGRDTLP